MGCLLCCPFVTAHTDAKNNIIKTIRQQHSIINMVCRCSVSHRSLKIWYRISNSLSQQALTADLVCVFAIAGESTGVALCVSVLELLQWKEDVQDEAQLQEPLSQVLRHLLESTAQSAPAVRSKPAVDNMDLSNEDEDADSVDTEAADDTQK